MARKYQVQHTVNLSTPSDPNTFVAQGVVDLPVLLSQRLQKNIRQGRVFNIHSVKASLHDQQGAGHNLDLGGAIVGEIRHTPATSNSCKAWRHLFAVWRKQKSQIVSGIGPQVRYDDFEVAFNSNYVTSRTSNLYATGINDPTPESVVIYGGSTEGSHVTLEDTYESMQPTPNPSRFPLSNNVVKEAKFTNEFPNTVKTPFSAHWSAQDNQATHDSGASVSQPTSYIKDSASLCGVVYYQAQMLPENVAASVQDELALTLTFTVSIGMSLAKTPRKSYSRRQPRISKFVSYKSKGTRSSKAKAWKRYRRK